MNEAANKSEAAREKERVRQQERRRESEAARERWRESDPLEIRCPIAAEEIRSWHFNAD